MEVADTREGSIELRNGRYFLFKGGEERLITEKEYRRLRPYHKDMSCSDCTFVPEKELILLHFVTAESKERVKRGGGPMPIGNFCLPGFILSHLEFYLFRCGFCGEVGVSHLCGGGRRLFCDNCQQNNRIRVARNRGLLEKAGLSEEALKHYSEKDEQDRRLERNQYLRFGLVLGASTLILTWMFL